MSLTPQEMQELAELEELEALEAEEASVASRGPALEQEQGLKGGAFTPSSLARMAADALGFDTGAAGRKATNALTYGHLPNAVGAVKSLAGNDYVTERDKLNATLAEDSRRSPVSSMLGSGAGMLAGAAPLAGAGVVRNAAVAGGTGVAYNPGDTAGEVDPIQAGDRLKNGGLSALLGTGLGVAGKGIAYGAKKAADVRMVKDGAGLAKRVVGEVDKALSGFNEKQIAPRMDKLREFLKGKSISVNPERVAAGGLDKLGAKMAQKAAPAQPSPMLGSQPTPTTPQRVNISAERGLRLKQALAGKANYGKSKPHDPSATAKGEEAAQVAGSVRRQLEDLGPEVRQINEEVAERIALRDALQGKMGTTPIEAITVKPGTSNYSVVKSIDEGAGSDLVGLGQRIKSGQDLLIQPSKLLKPLEAPNELRKLGVRGASSLAEALQKLPEGTGQAAIRGVLEGKRRAK